MTTLLLILVILMLFIGAPIFVVMIAAATLGGLSLLADQDGTLIQKVAGYLVDLTAAGTGERAQVLSTIPLFIFAGYMMAEAKTAQRLVRLASAAVGWLPGGLAIVTVFACAIFTIFSGASGVTIVALGSLVMPSLLKQGYPQRFSLGLVAGTGSIGLLFPPALPLFVYGTVYGLADQMARDSGSGAMELSPFSTERFLFAGIVPGLVLCLIICAYAVAVAIIRKVPRQKFSTDELLKSLIPALPEVMIPFIIAGGIITGVFTIPESAAVTALYVFIIEAGLFRDIGVRDMGRITRESMGLVGAIFIIVLCSEVLKAYFVDAQVPNAIVAWVKAHIDSKIAFLLALNVLLLLVGMMMDIFSAIVVVVPLITPTAMAFGIDPYHLGVIFLLNLELGYLTPPVGLNLFITSFKFDKPIVEVIRSTLPFLAAMVVALGLVTYVPWLTTNFVPDPARKGRHSGLMITVKDAADKASMVSSVKLPDGTEVTPQSCEAIEDAMIKITCTTLLKDFSACDEGDESCQKDAIDAYLAEQGEEGDDLDLDDLDDLDLDDL